MWPWNGSWLVYFEGSAGKRMTSSPNDGCGLMNREQPCVAEGAFHFPWYSSCCNWSTTIQVRNWGSYYMYFPSGVKGEQHSVADGAVTRQAFYPWHSNSCTRPTTIKAKNCGSHYVYYLSVTSPSLFVKYYVHSMKLEEKSFGWE